MLPVFPGCQPFLGGKLLRAPLYCVELERLSLPTLRRMVACGCSASIPLAGRLLRDPHTEGRGAIYLRFRPAQRVPARRFSTRRQ